MASKTGYTAEQLLERAMVWIMRSPNFVSYSGVCMVGDVRVDDKCPTAYTDGLNCVYGRKFIEGLTEPEIRAVVLHENLHKMFRHLVVWRKLFEQSAPIANMACDYVINLMIANSGDAGVKLPKEGLIDQRFTGMDSQQVFATLLKENPNAGQGGKCSGNCHGASSGQQGQGTCTCPQGFDEHDWNAANDMSQEEAQAAQEAIDQAIRQGAILAGKMNGNVPREIGELLDVKIDYKAMLREFMTSSVRGGDETSWVRPNRRWVGADVLMPSTISESMGEIVLAIDTSGSIGGPQLTYFLSNVARILKSVNPEKVHLLYWDCHVAAHEVYDPVQYDTLPSSTKPAGGGGTSPSCIPKYIKKHNIKPTCIVVLTDGYIDQCPTDWNAPVLWAVQGLESFTGNAGDKVLTLPNTTEW